MHAVDASDDVGDSSYLSWSFPPNSEKVLAHNWKCARCPDIVATALPSKVAGYMVVRNYGASGSEVGTSGGIRGNAWAT